MEFYETIKTELSEFDIGLLIANAGIYIPGLFEKT